MNIEILKQFFMWATVLNFGLLAIWTLVLGLMPEFAYRAHIRFVKLSRESWNNQMFALLAFYKLMVMLFFATPWVVLLVIT